MFFIILILLFIRPFICSLAFPYLNDAHSIVFLLALSLWCARKKIRRLEFGQFKTPISLLLGALAVSVIVSRNKPASFFELYKYLCGILLFFFAASLDFKEQSVTIKTIVLSACVIGGLAIYQYFFSFDRLLNYLAQNPNTAPFALDYIERRRVFFPFVTPNALAGYLIMTMPLFFINTAQKKWCASLPCIALLLTKSIGAFLTLCVVLTPYLYRKWQSRRKFFFSLCILCALIGISFYLRTKTAYYHAQPAFSVFMRLGYWENTLSLVKTHLLAGIGPGTFKIPGSLYAHNSYLQFMAETGIFGLFSFLWLVTIIIKENIRSLRSSISPAEASLFLMANAAFLIHNIVDFTFFLPEVALIWWVIAGLSLPRLAQPPH
ncbi:MAG: O-antigen ligase family protein [Candidatus Omnitrophota bacterium]